MTAAVIGALIAGCAAIAAAVIAGIVSLHAARMSRSAETATTQATLRLQDTLKRLELEFGQHARIQDWHRAHFARLEELAGRANAAVQQWGYVRDARAMRRANHAAAREAQAGLERGDWGGHTPEHYRDAAEVRGREEHEAFKRLEAAVVALRQTTESARLTAPTDVVRTAENLAGSFFGAGSALESAHELDARDCDISELYGQLLQSTRTALGLEPPRPPLESR